MFKLEFSTDNAAFEGEFEVEVIRILETVSDRVNKWHREELVKDINGNTIGKWSLDHE